MQRVYCGGDYNSRSQVIIGLTLAGGKTSTPVTLEGVSFSGGCDVWEIESSGGDKLVLPRIGSQFFCINSKSQKNEFSHLHPTFSCL